MNQSVISDNWALQEIAELFTSGFDALDTSYIAIDRASDSYSHEGVSHAAIATECLFNLITDIVLRDQILVDERFTEAWKQAKNPLDSAHAAKVIRPFPFLRDAEKLDAPRKEFVNQLCATSDLRLHQQENENDWVKNGSTPHPYLSQIVWGGAGMLARCYVFEQCYTPHPIRKKILVDTGLALPCGNAAVSLKGVIEETRARLVTSSHIPDQLHSLLVTLPPLPISVIQEANSPKDLITVALELREEYTELRHWLRQFQNAIDSGKLVEMAKFAKILQSISLYADSKIGKAHPNSPTFTTGVSIFNFSMKAHPLEWVKNQVGIRSTVNKLIISKTGTTELNKFLGMFGHKDTDIGLKVRKHFSI